MKILKVIGFMALAAVVTLAAFWISNDLPKAIGSAPAGMRADTGSTSVITLASATRNQMFATSTCIARAVTTTSTPIMIQFTDHETYPTTANGHLQLGSTTVMYDAGTYGCGLWRAVSISGAAGQNVFVTQFLDFK